MLAAGVRRNRADLGGDRKVMSAISRSRAAMRRSCRASLDLRRRERVGRASAGADPAQLGGFPTEVGRCTMLLQARGGRRSDAPGREEGKPKPPGGVQRQSNVGRVRGAPWPSRLHSARKQPRDEAGQRGRPRPAGYVGSGSRPAASWAAHS